MRFLDALRDLFRGAPPAAPAPTPARVSARTAPNLPTPAPTSRRVTAPTEPNYAARPDDPRESSYLTHTEQAQLLQPRADGLPPLHLTRRNRELWLTEDTSGKFINADSRYLRRLGIWGVKVRGNRFYHSPRSLGPALLVREPDNPHDPNAVAIHAEGKRIGYYNKGMAPGLAKLLDSGETLEATLISTDPAKVLAARSEIIAHLRRHL